MDTGTNQHADRDTDTDTDIDATGTVRGWKGERPKRQLGRGCTKETVVAGGTKTDAGDQRTQRLPPKACVKSDAADLQPHLPPLDWRMQRHTVG